MYLYTKDVEKIGFKGVGLFDDSKWHHLYYAKFPKTRQIFIIDDLEHSVSHFNLTKEEWKAFGQDKLGLVPRGCCSVSRNPVKEHPILDFQGDWKKVFRTRNRTLAFIKKLMEQRVEL